MSLPELFANSPVPGMVAPFTALASAVVTTPAAGTVETWTYQQAPPAALALPGQFRIIVDQEICIDVTGAGGTSRQIQRGADGSTVTTHASSSNVFHTLTAGALSGVNVASPSAVIEGMNLWGYGNSYLQVGTAIAFRRYWERIFSWMRAGSSAAANKGVSSTIASDISNFVHGTFTLATANGTVAGTWTPSTTARGLVIWEGIRNDAGWDGISSTTRSRAGFVNGLDSFLRLIRAQSTIQDTNGAFVFTGTWTSAANTKVPGGNSHNTTTPGDFVTITTPSGTDFDVILLGGDSTIVGTAFTVSIDGTDVTANLAAAGYPTTTNGQMSETKNVAAAPWVPLAVPCRGLSAGTHTIKITHAGTSGQSLFVCRLLTPSTTPVTVFANKANKLGTGTNTGYNSYVSLGNTLGSPSYVTDQIYNGLLETVLARFGSPLTQLNPYAKCTPDQSIVTWDPVAAGWTTSMISNGDASGVHPGDVGFGFYANGMYSVLNSLSARNGLSQT